MHIFKNTFEKLAYLLQIVHQCDHSILSALNMIIRHCNLQTIICVFVLCMVLCRHSVLRVETNCVIEIDSCNCKIALSVFRGCLLEFPFEDLLFTIICLKALVVTANSERINLSVRQSDDGANPDHDLDCID